MTWFSLYYFWTALGYNHDQLYPEIAIQTEKEEPELEVFQEETDKSVSGDEVTEIELEQLEEQKKKVRRRRKRKSL